LPSLPRRRSPADKALVSQILLPACAHCRAKSVLSLESESMQAASSRPACCPAAACRLQLAPQPAAGAPCRHGLPKPGPRLSLRPAAAWSVDTDKSAQSDAAYDHSWDVVEGSQQGNAVPFPRGGSHGGDPGMQHRTHISPPHESQEAPPSWPSAAARRGLYSDVPADRVSLWVDRAAPCCSLAGLAWTQTASNGRRMALACFFSACR
jgi:hypothetical protein